MTLDAERSLNIREWPGSGEPLVLLRGLLSSSAAWRDVAAVMTRRCLAPNLPVGRSSRPTKTRPAAYADDVIRGVGARIDSFSPAGHSFGIAVATAAAKRLPRAVIELVLCAAPDSAGCR
ncbi:MAG: alpha/beta hydrolase [Solirubrobacterales bacterium]|nr:alpha/beta hydrolase [Solirubrobacterales bacterium]